MSKTILLIGSSGGLGNVISNWFAEKGFNLAMHFHKHEPIVPAGNHKKYKADITDENQVQQLIKQVIADFGKIDVVINNAGISKSEMSWKTSA